MATDGAATGGGYSMGFQMQPLTTDGGLDTSLDFRGGRHSWKRDPLYKMSCENREKGNDLVKEAKYEQAIAQYSELIMKTRSLENEEDVTWEDDGKEQVRLLRATAYLNLSLCFLKLEQWTHASNTATRAIQGDKEPPEPNENVLPADKKAKALFRRATAQCEGFGNFDKALEDLRKAKELTPEDKGIEQMLRKCVIAVKKTEKAADKKMAGFLGKADKSGDGIFDEASRQRDTEAPKLTETKKLQDGLWLVPQDKEQAAQAAAVGGDAASTAITVSDGAGGEEKIDFDEVSREIREMKEEKPELYEEVRQKIATVLKDHAEAVKEEETKVGEEEKKEGDAEKKPEA
eukprot:TRINITY_DN19824_c0_g1_i1.p1 TRINITY_DN19824_c0_g1~~TRINITY_DN19824_c0_g1_i1.p1  ORF type:complete len:375 (-),score=110.20 TRINITY_DN19824_c0_g1_i1:33-1073(-)